jgi:hypothetical protein
LFHIVPGASVQEATFAVMKFMREWRKWKGTDKVANPRNSTTATLKHTDGHVWKPNSDGLFKSVPR